MLAIRNFRAHLTPAIPNAVRQRCDPRMRTFSSVFKSHIDYRKLSLHELHRYLRRGAAECFEKGTAMPLPNIMDRLLEARGKVVDRVLPYCPTPDTDDDIGVAGSIVLLAHVIPPTQKMSNILSGKQKIVLSTGFTVLDDGIIVTCHHTFDQIWPVVPPIQHIESTSVALASDGTIFPVVDILAALPDSDLIVLKLGANASNSLKPLGVTPYPASVGTSLRAYIHSDQEWAPCRVLAYKNALGSKAETGTYDDLAAMEIDTIVPPGSSGGPLLDANGAVCGVLRGHVKIPTPTFPNGYSFGTPSEKLFELFKFPFHFNHET